MTTVKIPLIQIALAEFIAEYFRFLAGNGHDNRQVQRSAPALARSLFCMVFKMICVIIVRIRKTFRLSEQ